MVCYLFKSGGISSFMHAVILTGFYKKYFMNLPTENLDL